MKKIFLILSIIVLSFHSISHEGEEEVEEKFSPKYGGRVSSVIERESIVLKSSHKHDHDHHDNAKFMSEIIISDDNKIRLYFYDLSMKQTDLTKFPSEIVGIVRSKKNSKIASVTLQKKNGYFVGDMSVIKNRPYDLFFEFLFLKSIFNINFNSMD